MQAVHLCQMRICWRPTALNLDAELADLSTNPAAVRAANPRLKPQTISGSIAQVCLLRAALSEVQTRHTVVCHIGTLVIILHA